MSDGFSDVGRGFAFLGEHPRLWRYVLMPAVVSAALLLLLVVLVMHLASGATHAVTDHLPHFLVAPIGALLMLLITVVLAAGALLVFASLAGAIAGPFLERLSEAVEHLATGREGPPVTLRSFLSEAAVGAGHALVRLAESIGFAIGLFVLSFVPVIGALAAVAIGGYLAARATAYDCYDSILARRHWPLATKRAFLAAHRARTFGLGGAVAAMLIVPVLNVVALGIGAIGATLAMQELAPLPAPATSPGLHTARRA